MHGVRKLRTATAVVWLVMGAGHVFGPSAWRSSPSYEVISAVMPLRVWGLLFLLIGTLQLVSLRPTTIRYLALVAGAAMAATWATSFVAAALIHRLTGVGGPALWGYLAFSQILDAGRPLWRLRAR